jgi:hypothetical protein
MSAIHRAPRKVAPALPRPAAIAAATLTVVGWLVAAPWVMADSPAPPIPETQATIKRLGFGISQITLRERAAQRHDSQTDTIREHPSGRTIAPFASIIYDLDGDAWVYVVSAPLTYVRQNVAIERIVGPDAYLTEGPPPGTEVVIVGVPELYGTEVGVNGE